MAIKDTIYDAIMAGGATQESLLELTGTSKEGLASQFTYLRMREQCPVVGDDGVYSIVTTEEWKEQKAAKRKTKKPVSTLTFVERLEKAERKVNKMAIAYDKAFAALEANPAERELELKLTIAECNLELATAAQGKVEAARVQEDGSVTKVEDVRTGIGYAPELEATEFEGEPEDETEVEYELV